MTTSHDRMLEWTSTSANADVVECYFCTEKCRLQSHKGKTVVRDHLPVIAGSIYRFKCPYCESWNVKDAKTGEFVDVIQDVNSNASSGIAPGRYRRSQRFDDSPFCHNCTTNQKLQIQLLAGFFPATTTAQEERELTARLPAYKESLEARYPIVCPLCQGKIEEIIKERNWKAKARTVGGWLKSSSKLVQDTSAEDVTTASRFMRGPERLWLWQCKGLCWRILYLSTTLALVTYGMPREISSAIIPTYLAYWASTLSQMPLSAIIATSTIFCSFWDPTYKARVVRNGKAEHKGRATWLALQGMLFIVRLLWAFDIFGLYELKSLLAFASAASHLTLLLFYRKITYIRGPQRIKLIERSSLTAPGAVHPPQVVTTTNTPPNQPGSAAFASHRPLPTTPAFGQVSMGSTPPISRMYKRHGFGPDIDEDDEMDEDDQSSPGNDMDWQPFDEHLSNHNFEDVDMQGSTSSETVLRPAVFNPENEWNLVAYGMKGLDSLFASGVSLSDAQHEVTSTSKEDRAMPAIWVILASFFAVFGVGFYYIHTGKTQTSAT